MTNETNERKIRRTKSDKRLDARVKLKRIETKLRTQQGKPHQQNSEKRREKRLKSFEKRG